MPKAGKQTVSPFAGIADELGALESEMAPHQSKLARIETLRKTLRAACPVGAQKEWIVTGSKWIAHLGACGNVRLVNVPELVKRIGSAMYASFARCTLKDLEEIVAPAIVAAVVTNEPSGARPLKTFAREAV